MEKDVLILGNKWHAYPDLFYWKLPESINVEITNRCDLQCAHCFHSRFRFRQGDLEPETFARLEPHLKTIRRVALSSAGEPLLNPHFDRYLAWCLKEGLEVRFTTNGQRLDRHIETLLGNEVQVSVSIDGATPETYRKTRGPGFDRLLNNLVRLHERKKESGTLHPSVHFIFVASRANIEDLPLLIDLAARFDVPTVYCFHRLFYDEDLLREESLIHEPERFDRILLGALRKARASRIDLVHPGSFDGTVPIHPAGSAYVEGTIDDFDCRWVETQCTVAFNGIVMACCFADCLFMGNVLGDDLRDIWNGPAYRGLRARIAGRNYPHPCKECIFRQILARDEVQSYHCLIDEASLYNPERVPPLDYRISELDPRYQEAIRSVGAGNPGEAVVLLQKLLDVDAHLFEAANALGISLAMDGREEAARSAFSQALDSNPAAGAVRRNLAALDGHGFDA